MVREKRELKLIRKQIESIRSKKKITLLGDVCHQTNILRKNGSSGCVWKLNSQLMVKHSNVASKQIKVNEETEKELKKI